MNMIGHPKHVQKCLDVGVDLICAQGGEGGGHTGDVPTTVLIPTVAALVKGKKSPLTGEQVQVVAAGGLFNGQSVAAALMLGANAVWIGTRFIMAEEAGASRAHQDAVKNSGFDDNVRTIIFTVRLSVLFFFSPTFSLLFFFHFTAYSLLKAHKKMIKQGRPLRVLNNPYIRNWEENRAQEIKDLTSRGIVPVEHDIEQLGDDLDDETEDNARPFLMGKAAAVINERMKAKEIVDEMVDDAVVWLERGKNMVVVGSSGGRAGLTKL